MIQKVVIASLLVAIAIAGALAISARSDRRYAQAIGAKRRALCDSARSQLDSLYRFRAAREHNVSAERAEAVLEVLSAPAVLDGCDVDRAHFAAELEKAQDCYIKSADAECIAAVAAHIAAGFPSN